MNLISCDNCGVVYDKDKLRFPEWVYDEDKGEYINDMCEYLYDPRSGRKRYVPFITCLICGERIYDYGNGG